jgi:hypothetical protein
VPDASVTDDASAIDATAKGDSSTSGCAVCSAGHCEAACAAGTIACGSGTPPTCVDPMNDPGNCGGCGHTCPSGQGCLQGVCAASCFAGPSSGCAPASGGPSSDAGVNCSFCGANYTACGLSCADLGSDPRNCGACGTQCAAGQSCQSGVCKPLCAGGGVCAGGVCGGSCPAGQTECGGGTNATGSCVDTQTDSSNCGGCGKQCPAGEACAQGVCAASCGATAHSGCAGSPGGPSPDGGMNCSYCGQNYTACGVYCVDLGSDPTHCGACGVACGPGQICTAGTCGPICPNQGVCANGVCLSSCPAGSMQCAATGMGNATPSCTNVASDPGNCGACGNVCPQGEACFAGQCVAACGATGAVDASAPAADGGTASGGGGGPADAHVGGGPADAQLGGG